MFKNSDSDSDSYGLHFFIICCVTISIDKMQKNFYRNLSLNEVFKMIEALFDVHAATRLFMDKIAMN